MSALGLLPWPLHQAFVYVAGVFAVLVPFLFDLTDGVTLPLFVGIGVVLLAVGVLSRGPAGVAQVLPAGVHAGVVYLLGFFLVIAPFIFGFADEDTPLLVAIALGLIVLVVTLLTRFPTAEAEAEAEAAPADAGDATGRSRHGAGTTDAGSPTDDAAGAPEADAAAPPEADEDR